MLASPIQSVLYAVITKSVGSAYRIADDWKAPPAIRQKTIEREAVLLGLATAFATGIQMAFSRFLPVVFKKAPALRPYELLLRALATAPALVFAEGVSRRMAPKAGWVKAPAGTPVDRFERHPAISELSALPSLHRPVGLPLTATVVAEAMPIQRFSAMAKTGPFQAMQRNRLSTAPPFRYDRRDDEND